MNDREWKVISGFLISLKWMKMERKIERGRNIEYYQDKINNEVNKCNKVNWIEIPPLMELKKSVSSPFFVVDSLNAIFIDLH